MHLMASLRSDLLMRSAVLISNLPGLLAVYFDAVSHLCHSPELQAAILAQNTEGNHCSWKVDQIL